MKVPSGPDGIVKLLGLAALGTSLGLLAVGIVIYGHEMAPHVLATIAGVFAEVALVVLVLDRLARAQAKQSWSFVRGVVGRRMAASMVDVIRLCGIRWSPDAYAANHERHDEFVRLAELHLADLRSNVQGLAIAAEPGDYRDARKIELRLAWLVRYLREPSHRVGRPGSEYFVASDTARLIQRFLDGEQEFGSTLALADKIVAKTWGDQPADRERFWRARMAAQNALLRLTQERGSTPGIVLDIDGDLAMKYFALDCKLLKLAEDDTFTLRVEGLYGDFAWLRQSS
jgi:hypothetical protein